MSKTIKLTLICLVSLSATAQDTLLTDVSLVPLSAIKISPFHLLNTYPSMQVAYEHGFGAVTIQIEAGYVSNLHSRPEYNRMRGAKPRVEVRYYFNQVSARRKILYGAAEFYANLVDFERYDWVEECFDEACQRRYRRKMPYEVRYREEGINLKAGSLFYAARWQGVLFDLNIGLSLRNIQYHMPETSQRSLYLFGPREEDNVRVSPCVGIRMGYRWR